MNILLFLVGVCFIQPESVDDTLSVYFPGDTVYLQDNNTMIYRGVNIEFSPVDTSVVLVFSYENAVIEQDVSMDYEFEIVQTDTLSSLTLIGDEEICQTRFFFGIIKERVGE